MVINEEHIRAQERQAAGQQLTQHIAGIITHHALSKKLRLRSGSGGGSSSGGGSDGGGSRRSPTVSVTSLPARGNSGAGLAHAIDAVGDTDNTADETQGRRSCSVSSAAAQLAASAALQAAQQGRLRLQSHVAAEGRADARSPSSARQAPAAAGDEAVQQARPRQSSVAVFGLPGLAQHVGHQMGIPSRTSQGPATS